MLAAQLIILVQVTGMETFQHLLQPSVVLGCVQYFYLQAACTQVCSLASCKLSLLCRQAIPRKQACSVLYCDTQMKCKANVIVTEAGRDSFAASASLVSNTYDGMK